MPIVHGKFIEAGENDNFDATIHVIENDELQRRYDSPVETRFRVPLVRGLKMPLRYRT